MDILTIVTNPKNQVKIPAGTLLHIDGSTYLSKEIILPDYDSILNEMESIEDATVICMINKHAS
jgi:hypothetical protein